MNTNSETSQPIQTDDQTHAPRARRQYSEAFKADLLHASSQPGANVSAIARSHDIRANQLRRWLQKAKGGQPTKKTAPQTKPTQTSFVAVALQAQPTTATDIRMNLQSAGKRIQIDWPMVAASQCAQWVREVLA